MVREHALLTQFRLLLVGTFCLFFGLASCAVYADPLALVTPAETARERAFVLNRLGDTPKAKTAPAPDAPRIEVEAPKLGGQLRAPFAIRLIFEPAAGAQIVPDSFKVLYGYLGLDITDRVLRHVKPTTSGLVVGQAAIPAGDHRLRLQVGDDKGRRGETTLSFSVLSD